MSSSNFVRKGFRVWLVVITLLTIWISITEHFANYFIVAWVCLLFFFMSLGVWLKSFWLKQVCFSLTAIFFVFTIFEFYWGGGYLYTFSKKLPINQKNHIHIFSDYNFSLQQGIIKDTVVAFNESRCTSLTYHIPGWGDKYCPLAYYYRQLADQDGVIFNEKVHINIRGERVVLGATDCAKKKKVWVVGGSFAFGDGVSDQDTLPAKLQHFLGDQFCVRNMGIPGNGIHQVLYQLEHLEVKQKVDHIVLITIPDHYFRMLGLRSWTQDQPCYSMKHGNLETQGSFINCQNRVVQWIKGSAIFYKLISKLYPVDERILTAIGQKINDVAKQKFKAQLSVFISSSLDDAPSSKFAHAIRRSSKTSTLANLELTADEMKNIWIPRNSHPSAFFNQKLAKFLASKIK